MTKFIFIFGPTAAGKTTFMEKTLYRVDMARSNFFDPDRGRLMMQLYALESTMLNDSNLDAALNNALDSSISGGVDFILEIKDKDSQLKKVDAYLKQYRQKLIFHAHFIGVKNVDILKERAKKRELLGGHTSGIKAIENSFEQSFRNFILYLPNFEKATIWDNSKELGFKGMEEQLVFENGILVYENPQITDYCSSISQQIRKQYPSPLLTKRRIQGNEISKWKINNDKLKEL